MKVFALIAMVALVGCSSTTKVSEKSSNKEVVVIKEHPTPHLWAGHKQLTESIEVCASKAESILSSLGFSNITKSVYESETYLYANFLNNRAGIHCTSIGGKTFVYGSVAGAEAKSVETLRNNIFWKF